MGVSDAAGHVSRLLWPGTPWGRISVRPSIIEFTGFHRWWLVIVVAVLIAMPALAAAAVRPGEAVEPDASEATGPDRLPIVASLVALGALTFTTVSISLFVEPAYRYLYGPLQSPAVFAVAVAFGGVVAAGERWAGRPVPSLHRFISIVVPVAIVVVFMMVPRQDGPSVERRELAVEGAVSAALARRPSWESVEAVPLDLRGAGDLDAEVLDVALRRGVDARSRRVELGLEPPDHVDGVFGVAMSPTRECLLAADETEEIIRGTSATGDVFSVIAFDRDSVAYDRCVGLPAR